MTRAKTKWLTSHVVLAQEELVARLNLTAGGDEEEGQHASSHTSEPSTLGNSYKI
jgi:hypothetical protein